MAPENDPFRVPMPLSDEEIQKLRNLLTVADIVQEEAEYRAAFRLVIKTWKKLVLGLATIIGAVLILREQGKVLWSWFIGG